MEASLPSPFAVPSVARVRAFHASLCRLSRERFGSSPAGRFLLADALSRGGDLFVLAANIAGAASLTAESDSAAIRYAIRNGIVDFAVTHPDEALRILKNEVRKGQPVCVCLEWAVTDTLRNLMERGAQPDVIAWTVPDDPAIAPFLARGAGLIAVPLDNDLAMPLSNPGYLEVEWSAPDPGGPALRRMDAIAAEIVGDEDWERRSWIAAAPRYLPRQLRSRRCVSMTRAEIAAFEQALRNKLTAGEIGVDVELRIANEPPILLHQFA